MSGWGNELGMVLAEAVVRAGTGREEGPGLQEDYRKNRGRIERHPGLARRADGKLVWACFEKTDTEVVWHIASWFGVQSQPGTET